MPAEKPNINLVVIGHIDHGKSTLMGRFLAKLGVIDERIIKQLEEEAKRRGKDTFLWAYVFDTHKEERDRGITIDIAMREFETPKYHVTIIDAPGHRDFVKNMLKGAAQADHALLVVSAKPGEAEAGTADNGQTTEHILLVKTFGVKQMIVVINKMDTVNYDKKRFEEVWEMVKRRLLQFGWNIEKQIIGPIPVSAWEGENLTERSSKMPWYSGPCLLEAIDMLEPPEKPIDKPLRIPVQAVYNIKGVGLVLAGRVVTGCLKEGDNIVIEPADKTAQVKSIEMFHKRIPQAVPGDNIGFNVKGDIEKKDVKRGDMVGHPDNKPTVAKEFIARVMIIQHPTAISVGYTPVIHAHEASVAGQFVELIRKIDPRTGTTIEENPQMLKPGDIAEVRIRPIKPLCIEEVAQFPQLARFAIRDMSMTIGLGVVQKITEKKE
ncbi:MAG: translation elongation factor EF-1 subunit alpha [bacterium]|nr:translation elongation factor EF-1 subunit alpha [bacterium]